ncbi:MAG: 2-oxoacid:acceptor oxidoreductase subunit alpha [Phycisphaerae bacterium]|nr:2-oxoacid:acceptor oxidoreductase subunit alpha [Phycisphaerae bacterium]
MDITIRVAGEAGQGVQTTGTLLAGVCGRLGLHVAATKSYMSRIRGGLNWFDVRLGEAPLCAGRDDADVLVALSEAALDVLGGGVRDGGVALYDGDEAPGAATGVNFTQIARDVAESKVMANTVATGAIFAVCGYDVEKLCDYLREQFADKGEDVAEKNVACARAGAERVGALRGALTGPKATGAPPALMTGAEAIGLAAATAGVKLAAAYPMTPGTGTFTTLASLADDYGIVVEQAEDEIAAVNMLCGATYGGVPAMASTSGGGFALMAEGLSLAGIMELPICIVVAQRPGPATGLPTRTGQQDLQFALRAGHGEFARAVYAPGTVAQCGELTRRALQTAHRFQTPALILTDQFLQDFQTNVDEPDRTYRPIDRCLADDAGKGYKRYAVTDSGVSPRAIPGGDAFVVVDSDSHTDAGKISEDLRGHVAQQDKRMRKAEALADEALAPEYYGPDDAERLLVCWGSTYGPCREAVDANNADRRRKPAAMLHFAQVWPLHVAAARDALGGPDEVYCVEGNQTAQFAALLRECGLLDACALISRYDGMPFTARYILEAM